MHVVCRESTQYPTRESKTKNENEEERERERERERAGRREEIIQLGRRTTAHGRENSTQCVRRRRREREEEEQNLAARGAVLRDRTGSVARKGCLFVVFGGAGLGEGHGEEGEEGRPAHFDARAGH